MKSSKSYINIQGKVLIKQVDPSTTNQNSVRFHLDFYPFFKLGKYGTVTA